jgi:chaperonin cofactor prefoldin
MGSGDTGTASGPALTQTSGSGTGTGSDSGASSGTQQSADDAVSQLRQRIGNALQKRARRFDSATAALVRQRERLEVLAGQVKQLGGDTARIQTRLRECEQLLVKAREQEQTATQMFRRLADESDKSGAFVRARTQARNAVQTMSQVRTRLQQVADEIEEIVDDLDEGGGTE